MKLDNFQHGLPKWPFIDFYKERKECIVYGRHATYWRGKIIGCVWSIIGCLCLLLVILLPLAATTSQGSRYLFFSLAACWVILFLFVPIVSWLCHYVFPGNTLVGFSPGNIIINSQRYPLAPHISIQFRASESYLSQTVRRRLESHRNPDVVAFDLSQRKLEMIYGSRLVFISAMEKELAEQFVSCLQFAYALNLQMQSQHVQHQNQRRAIPE